MCQSNISTKQGHEKARLRAVDGHFPILGFWSLKKDPNQRIVEPNLTWFHHGFTAYLHIFLG